MSFVSQIPTDREIYAFEELSFEYPWIIEMFLTSKHLYIHRRDSDMKLTYKWPHTDMSFISQIPRDREIWAFDKLAYE
jgi:hypothetical protein